MSYLNRWGRQEKFPALWSGFPIRLPLNLYVGKARSLNLTVVCDDWWASRSITESFSITQLYSQSINRSIDKTINQSVFRYWWRFAGINMTGMYFNPAMATGHTFGCKGTTAWEHVFVYWIGPFIGCFLAMLMDRMLHFDATATVAMETKKKQWSLYLSL